MGFYSSFQERSREKGQLCVGLDPEISKMPEKFRTVAGLYEFCREIADATADFASAFKPNIAFFESSGSEGILQFEKLVAYLKKNHPAIPLIADAKRGDLGNTAKEYARYFFEVLQVDALTLSPYMGRDSIEPFLEFQNSFVFLLCLTSNPGSADFQKKIFTDGETLFTKVANLAESLGKDKAGLVVGGTNPQEMSGIRKKHPELVFLVPGVGAQGGDSQKIVAAGGKNSVISVSRSILYASSGNDFAEKARAAAAEFSAEMI